MSNYSCSLRILICIILWRDTNAVDNQLLHLYLHLSSTLVLLGRKLNFFFESRLYPQEDLRSIDPPPTATNLLECQFTQEFLTDHRSNPENSRGYYLARAPRTPSDIGYKLKNSFFDQFNPLRIPPFLNLVGVHTLKNSTK